MIRSDLQFGEFLGSRRGKGRAGFSYVEILLATLILSGLLVTGLELLGNLGRSRQGLTDADAAACLVADIFREIKDKAYADPVDPFEFGSGTDEPGRAAYDDIDDYHNREETPPQDRAGTPLAGFAQFTRSIRVAYVAADNFNQKVLSDQGFKEVEITIYRGEVKIECPRFIIANAPAEIAEIKGL